MIPHSTAWRLFVVGRVELRWPATAGTALLAVGDLVALLRGRAADAGFLGQWINPRSGKRHRIWAFVMILACSRHMFVRPVIHLDQHAWTEAHVEAFRFFGGVTQRLVPDNLRTGVGKPDLYDPKINKAYAELAAHYGALVDPARAGRPKDKPRVERPMRFKR